MAATAAGTALTARHRLTQQEITARTLRLVLAVWPLLDMSRLDETAPGWLAQTLSLLQGGHSLSARAAAAYFAAFRAAEGVAGAAPVIALAPLDVEALRQELVVVGPVMAKAATGNGLPLERVARDALSRVSGVSADTVRSAGRATIIGAAADDREALGWARVASADACAFCGMLASRGAEYRSFDAASFEAHHKCGCDVETVYAGWDMPGTSRLWLDRYEAANGGDEEFRAQRREAFRAGRVPPRGKHTPQQLKELAAYLRSGRD